MLLKLTETLALKAGLVPTSDPSTFVFQSTLQDPLSGKRLDLRCVRKGKENKDGKRCVLESGSSVSHL